MKFTLADIIQDLYSYGFILAVILAVILLYYGYKFLKSRIVKFIKK